MRPGAHQDHVGGLHLQRLIQRDDQAVRNLQVAQVAGHLGVLDHAGTDERQLASVAIGGFSRLLHTRDQRGERADQDAALGQAEDLVEGAIDHRLGGRPTGIVGVGRVGQQRQNPPAPQLPQLAEIGRLAVHRGVVELVVAGVHDQPGGGGDPQSNAVRDGMAHMEELDLERAELDPLPGLHRVQLGPLQHAAAAQLDLQQTAGEGGGVDRRRDLFQHVADGAGVVFVAVGDHDPANLVALVLQVTKVGDDVIDPQHVVLGEHDAGVDHQHVVAILQRHHVLPDLPQSTQGDKP